MLKYLQLAILTASKCQGTRLCVHWKVLQMHGTARLDGYPVFIH